MAIRHGRPPALNTLQKVPALQKQGFIRWEVHNPAFRLRRHELSVNEIDSLIVKLEFAGFEYIVKNGHSPLSHDYQPLLLIRVKPTHKNMRSRPPVEEHRRNRHVGNIGLEICSARGCYLDRHIVEEIEDDGNIMGSKTPQRILLTANLPEV